MLDDSESIISDRISNLPSAHNHMGPPNLPAPECYMPQAHYFTVGSSISGTNDNYYLIDQQLPKPPMSMSSAGGGGGTLPHLQQMQKASSKSSTTSKSCSSTESQKIMIKNLIQQTNHSKFWRLLDFLTLK